MVYILGIVFAVDPDQNSNGQNNAGVALMNAYNYVRQEETNTDALAFITKVYSSIEDDSQDVTVK